VIREVKKDGYKYLGLLDQTRWEKGQSEDGVSQTGQESAAVIAEWRQHDQCHQHMGCVSSVLHS